MRRRWGRPGSYMDDGDTVGLEAVEEGGLGRVGGRALSDEEEGGVAELGAGLHQELAQVAGGTNDQDLALLCHD